MSFSSDVKEELLKVMPGSRHCQIAEIAAIMTLCGSVQINEYDEYQIKVRTENKTVAEKFYELVQHAFHIQGTVQVKRRRIPLRARSYHVIINHPKKAKEILQALKVVDVYGDLIEDSQGISSLLVQSDCCKRAFIRGSFLATGSMSDPHGHYHLEVVCLDKNKAEQIAEILNVFDLDAKIVVRKKYYVVYLKDGALIVDALNIMGAHLSLLEMENIRVEKEMRNTINRQVNCELANITKTVNAANKQVEDILFIKEKIGFGELTDGLKDIANLRLQYPDDSLKELGAKLDPPVGKSGVNHRLRKLSTIAEELRIQ
jgi:DNA-binding protein WhiA